MLTVIFISRFEYTTSFVLYIISQVLETTVTDQIRNIIKVIKISIIVAVFLLKTDRILKAIGLFKESLILLLQKALKIRKEIGDKRGEATDYGNLGTVFQSLGEYDKAEEYLQKALKIRKGNW